MQQEYARIQEYATCCNEQQHTAGHTHTRMKQHMHTPMTAKLLCRIIRHSGCAKLVSV